MFWFMPRILTFSIFLCCSQLHLFQLPYSFLSLKAGLQSCVTVGQILGMWLIWPRYSYIFLLLFLHYYSTIEQAMLLYPTFFSIGWNISEVPCGHLKYLYQVLWGLVTSCISVITCEVNLLEFIFGWIIYWYNFIFLFLYLLCVFIEV